MNKLFTEEISQLSIDLMVTYGCNLNCKKCYAPKTGYVPSYDEIVQTLDKLYDMGIKKIVLTGGEPLVYKDIVRTAKYAKEKGFFICLSTNGLLLKDRWPDISPYLSWVSISLDGANGEIDKLVIGEGGERHFKKVMEFLEFYSSLPQKTAKIKLGTVVTKKNKDHLVALGDVVFNKQPGYKPDIWRLYQFSEFKNHNNNLEYIDELSITEAEMHESMDILKKKYPKINISFATEAERDEAYIFIKPEQSLVYSKNGEYILLGDTKALSPKKLSELLYGIQHIWKKCISNRLMYS